MARRAWKWPLFGCIVPLLALGFDRTSTMHWIGGTDLEIEFLVTDAATGIPIPESQIEVRSDGGLYAESFKQEFVLVTDSSGTARKQCKGCTCFGTRSGLRLTDKFVVHLPWWQFRVRSAGYETKGWTRLDPSLLRCGVCRPGPGKSKTIVPVTLSKRWY